MAVLSCAYFALTLYNDNESGNVPPMIIGGFIAVFLAVFGIRCWAAESRGKYVRQHWLDVLSSLPIPAAGGIRLIRLLRLILLLKPLMALFVMKRPDGQQTAQFLFACLLVFWLGSAYALWVLERGVNPHLHSFGDSLFCSFLTVVTIGYGTGVTPITPEGRILTGVLIFIGIGLVGAASSRLTSWWLGQSTESEVDKSDRIVLAELQRLRTEIEALRRLSGKDAVPPVSQFAETTFSLASPDAPIPLYNGAPEAGSIEGVVRIWSSMG